uniref:Protein ARV n=1 Tax=Globodera rostochiensis TaxID=31243 RepID=A0A914HXI3_GLORO
MRPASSLFTLYSAGVIRITECKCGSLVDKYVEYDIVLVLIDLVLQYRQAYRHVLFNSNSKSFNRLIFIFVLCDAYKAWIERVEHLPGSQILFDLEWRFYLSLLRSAAEFGAYTSALFCFLKFFGQFDKFAGGSRGPRCFFESTLVGFYGSLFVVVSIIWQLHGHISYRFLTRLFIILSHLQVQRTLFPGIGLKMNLLAVSVAVSAQIVTGMAFQKFSVYF